MTINVIGNINRAPAPVPVTAIRPASVRTKGFSLRQSLLEQGLAPIEPAEGKELTEEQSDENVKRVFALERHLNFVYETLKVNPLLDITRYRATAGCGSVNASNPANFIMG